MRNCGRQRLEGAIGAKRQPAVAGGAADRRFSRRVQGISSRWGRTDPTLGTGQLVQASRAPQVVGQALEPQLHGIARQTQVAHRPVPVAPLQRPKHVLHRRPPRPDQGIAPLLPVGQLALVLVRAMHDPVLDPLRLQPPRRAFDS